MRSNNLCWLLFINFILSVSACGNAKNKNMKDTEIEPFEIEVSVFTGKPEGPRYFLNDKKLVVKYYITRWNPAGKAIEEEELLIDKMLPATEALASISKISTDEYHVIPHEGCEGGIQFTITLHKNNKVKKVAYACAKEYDEHTLQIIKFINENVSGTSGKQLGISL